MPCVMMSSVRHLGANSATGSKCERNISAVPRRLNKVLFFQGQFESWNAKISSVTADCHASLMLNEGEETHDSVNFNSFKQL